jgi:hypothetical protein
LLRGFRTFEGKPTEIGTGGRSCIAGWMVFHMRPCHMKEERKKRVVERKDQCRPSMKVG